MTLRSFGEAMDFLFPKTTHEETRQLLIKKIEALERIENSFYGVFRYEDRSFVYINPLVEKVLGYGVENFTDRGTAGSFFFSKVTPESMPRLFEQQAFYCAQQEKDNFDPKAANVMEFTATMVDVWGRPLPGFALSMMLDYRKQGSFGFYLGCWVFPGGLSSTKTTEIKSRLIDSYCQVKELLVKLYPDRFTPRVTTDKGLLTHFYLNPKKAKASRREQQILHALGKGLSSNDIAFELNISAHTVESHRKKLISKFNVKNTAELIKEVSKLYWIGDHPTVKPSEEKHAGTIRLSDQEMRVLSGLAQGASSKELAQLLNISTNTVEYHRKNLLAKLEAKNVAELILKASRKFWLE